MAAGYRSFALRHLGGVSALYVQFRPGYRSMLAYWMGGAWAGGIAPPIPEPPSAAHGAGMEQYRQSLREQAIAIDDEEILLIISEAIGAIE